MNQLLEGKGPKKVESDPYSLLQMAPKERSSWGPWKKLQDAPGRAGIFWILVPENQRAVSYCSIENITTNMEEDSQLVRSGYRKYPYLPLTDFLSMPFKQELMKVRVAKGAVLSSPSPQATGHDLGPWGGEGMENWDWSESGTGKRNTVLTEKASLPNINSASEKKKKR